MTRKRTSSTVAAAMLSILAFGAALARAEEESPSLRNEKIATLQEFAASLQFAVGATGEIVFPQVADGVPGGTRITTAINLANAGPDDFVVGLKFWRSDGRPMSVELDDVVTGTGSLGGRCRFHQLYAGKSLTWEY